MRYYDLHIETNENVEEIIELAKRLGYAGIALVNVDKETANSLSKKHGINIINCKMIVVSSKDELKKELTSSRMKYELILVGGGLYEVNRAACEDPRVDVLCHPEKGRKDSGLDHICVKAASDNNVAIEINFSEILNSGNRAKTMALIRNNIMLCNKYDTKVVITSGANNKWGLRAPRDLVAIGFLLGMDLNKAIRGISTIPEEMIVTNKEKLEGRRFGNVKIIEGG